MSPQNKYLRLDEEQPPPFDPQTSPVPDQPSTLPKENKYRALDALDTAHETQMRVAQQDATTTTPERHAEVLKLSQQSGLPPDVVERDFDRLKNQFTAENHPYKEIMDRTPALASWLTDPNNAKLGQKELEQMGALEWLLKAPARAFAQSMNRMRYAELRTKSMFTTLTRDETDAMNSYKFNADRDGDFATKDSFFNKAYLGFFRLAGQSVEPTKYSLAGGTGGAVLGAGTGALAGGVGAVPGAVAGFSLGARSGLMYGVVKSTAMQEGSDTYDELLSLRDETGKPIDPDVARMAAITTGALNGLIESAGVTAALKRVPGLDKLVGGGGRAAMKAALMNPTVRNAFTRLAKNYAGGMTEQIAAEVAQRGVSIVGEELAKVASGESFDPQRRTKGDVGEDLLNTAIESIPEFAFGMAPGPAMSFAQDVQRARESQKSVEFFTALGNGVTDTKLATTMPAAFQDFMERAAEGPVKTLYQSTDAWSAYWTEKGIDPAEMATSVTGQPNALETAQKSGMLTIPTARYAATLAGTEHNAFFIDELRLGDPRAMNGREGKEFIEKVQATKERIAAELKAAQEAPEGAALEDIKEAVIRQLGNIGVPRETSATMAEFAAGIGRLTQRAGFDARDTFASYGLDVVRRAAPQAPPATGEAAPAVLNQDPAGKPTGAKDEEIPGLADLEAGLGSATIENIDPDAAPTAENASGESGASYEAIKRQRDMAAGGRQFVVYDRAGRRRVILGPDAVDYNPARGETFGVETPQGFELRTDNGGRVPERGSNESPLGRNLSDALNVPRQLEAVPPGQRIDGEPGPANEQGVRAAFIGYQSGYKEMPTHALYNIEGGEFDGSTVGVERLEAEGIPVPPTPPLVQYNQQNLATSAPLRQWFGESVVVDEDGQPLVVYHGTTQSFTVFDQEQANIEADFGGGFYFTNNPADVAENYATVGPDLAGKIEQRAEQVLQELQDEDPALTFDEGIVRAREQVRSEFVTQEGLTMPVFLKMERPAELGGENETQLTYEVEYDDDGDVTSEGGTMLEFIEALRDAAASFYDGDIEPAITRLLENGIDGMSLREAIDTINKTEESAYYTDDEGNLAQHEIVRLALEKAGYDGIIDRTVDLKFGSQRRIGRAMAGMDEDTVHYIVFSPNQIKSAIGNRGTFDPTSPNILFQDAITPSPAQGMFFSKLTRALEESKSKRGTGAQWKGEIKNAKIGINQDEYAIALIDDLDDAASYGKEEVIAYIKQNQARVEEVKLGEETDEEYDPDEDDGEVELDEDEVNERATEIHDRMVDDAMDDLDWTDYTGTATFEEEEIEDEEEVEVQAKDDDDNPIVDEETGEPVMTTEWQTTTTTVYYAAISGGMVKRERRYGFEHRRGTEILYDEGTFDNEDDAERAAESIRESRERDDDLREYVYDQVREGVEYWRAEEEAREELINEGHGERQRDPDRALGTRYGQYQIEPKAEAGSYREIILTAADIGKRELLVAPTPEQVAMSMFGRKVSELDDLQKSVVEAGVANASKKEDFFFEWVDGHDNYKDIANPIVRIRLNVREALGKKIPAEPVEMSDGERTSVKAGEEAKADLDAMRLEVIARLNHEFTTEGKRLFRDQSFEIATDTRWQELMSSMTPAEMARFTEFQNTVIRGTEAQQAFDRYAAQRQNAREPSKRILFLEEVQPPLKDQQAKMPPIFVRYWRDLAMKYVMRYAVDKGFDTVAWTTGQQQVDHWSLEHKVRSIVTTVVVRADDAPVESDTYDRVVQINLPNGTSPSLGVDSGGRVVNVRGGGRVEKELLNQTLDKIMGDELAEQVMAHTGTEPLTLQGKGLRVGGKGLKNLYDADLGKTVKNLPAFKKHGGRIGQVEIRAKVKWHVEAGEEVSDEELAKQGITRRHPDSAFVMDNSGKVIEEFDGASLEQNRVAAKDYVFANTTVDQAQPAIFLTPEVAKAVQGGQALFQGDRYRPSSAVEKDALDAELQAVVKAAEAAAPEGADLNAFVTSQGEIYLASIMVPAGARGQGAGSKMLRSVLDFADEHNMQVSLRQDPDRGKKTALRRFYKREGFVKNGTARFYDASSTGSWVRPSKESRTRRMQADQAKPVAKPRGALEWGRDRKMTIALFENADLSTFLHETGHFYLEVFGDLIDKLDALDPTLLTPQQHQVRADYATILAHLGVTDRSEITMEHHELFARSFETYLMTGKAPSLRLREAFARVRAWFVGIYQSLRTLNAPLSPEIRKVFDRLLASDEEIAAAESAGSLAPMWLTPEQAQMSPERFALYRKVIEEAGQAATAKLDAQLMAEVQREQSAQWRERKTEIRAQVTTETHAMPVYQAISAMQRGTQPNGQPLVAGEENVPLKLSKEMLVAQFGPERLRMLPKTIYSVEGGVAAGVIADRFGFDSGDALLAAVSQATPMQRRIAQETERRMLLEHGSMMLDGTLHEKAMAAVAVEQREAVLREELKALGRMRDAVTPFEQQAVREVKKEAAYERRWLEAEAKLRIAIAEGRQQVIIDQLEEQVRTAKAHAKHGPARIRGALPPMALLRDQAREALAGTRVADLNPMLYWAAAKKASQKATEAAARQDFTEAITQKHQELISLALFRETEHVKDDIEKRVAAVKKIATPQSMAKLRLAGETYHDQVAGVLDRFEFAEVSKTALDRRAALWRWVQGQESQGISVDLPDELMDETRRTNYKLLTVEELVGVTDGIKQLVYLARFKNRLLKAEGTRQLNKHAQELDASIRANKSAKPRGRRDRTKGIELSRMAKGFFAAHRKLSSLLRELDGFVDAGPMWRAIMRPLNDAAAREADLNSQAAKRLHAIIEAAYPNTKKRQLYQQTFVPAIGESLSKMERLMYALNWGNEGNRDRVLNAEKWTAKQMQAVLDTLSVDDAVLVQSIFDLIGGYWPEIAAKQERVTGVRPEQVKALGFTIGTMELKGGYFPLKYDDRLSARADAMKDLEKANLQTAAAFTQATTRRGHTKARAESGNIPIRLDFGVIDEHIMQVVHDLTHHEALIDIGRILAHQDVQKAILETHGDLVFKAIKNSVRAAAFGDVPAADAVERALNHTRAGVTVVGLAWNLTTPLMQLLGFANSTVRLRPWWMAKGFARALGTPRSMTKTVEWIYEASPMMKTRGLTQQRELNEIRNTVGVYSGQLSAWMEEIISKVTLNTMSRAGIADSYFYMIGKMQQMVDVPTWLGAYEKAMSEGGAADGDETLAIAIADQAVLDTQGGGQMKDLAAVQRGAPALRIFTNFYTAGNVLYNQAVEVGKATRYTNPAQVGRALVDYMMLFVVPATGAYFIREALRPGEDEEPTEGVIRENLAYMVGTLVGFRELSGSLQDYFGYSGPAGARVFSSANNVVKQVSQGELDAALLRSVNELAGILFHYPAAQVWRTANGMAALAEGETEDPSVLVTGPEQ